MNNEIKNNIEQNADEQKKMGDYYYQIEKDYAKAAEYYKMAVEQNHTGSKHMLGFLYLSGLGVEKDLKKGFELTKESAEKNDYDGIINLAICYGNGWGTEVDYEKAVYWLKQGIKQNHPSAYFNLAQYYYYGFGVEKDFEKAAELLIEARNLGSDEANDFLNDNYKLKNGKYVKKKFLGLF